MDKFLLGAATAAHQVEGNNCFSDYWAMERLEHSSFKEPSGIGCDHYNRYREDIEYMRKAGMNAYRFSIEWARIEPQKGQYDEEALKHYEDVITCCIQNKITPIVTMHHFSSPYWLICEGGWENEAVVDYFADYCRYVAERLGDRLEYVCTINEANMRFQMMAITRMMMKNMGMNLQLGMNMELPEPYATAQKEQSLAFGGIEKVNDFLSPCTPQGDMLIMKAHKAAAKAMKDKCPHLKIGLTLSLHDIQPVPGGEELAARYWEEEFTHYLPYIKKDDFLGVQNYTRQLVNEEGELPVPDGKRHTEMGYEFYPEGIENVLRTVRKQLNIPLLVTENGVAALDDQERVEYIDTALKGVKKCMDDGIPVIGYLYWSLLDNFEWQLGYDRHFGLIEVDRDTMERKPKDSFYKIAEIWGKINQEELC